MSPLESLRALVEGWLSPRLDHLALYPCRVVAQDADGRLELVPDDTRIAPCTGIPIRLGLPGARVTVPAGGRVLLGYEHGDPARPYAALWESGTVTVVAFNGGATKVARDGEGVARSTGMATWMTAVSSFTGAANPTGAIGTVDGGTSVLKVP